MYLRPPPPPHRRLIHGLNRYKREWSAAIAYLILLVVVSVAAPTFFNLGNLRDVALSNAPVLIVAVGMTLIIVSGHIDISIGTQFAVCSVAAGLMAKTGMPLPLLTLMVVSVGGSLGAINGAIVAGIGVPSIVVTLATTVAWRDGLRWLTEGTWVQNLPANFQWLGLGQTAGQWLIVVAALTIWVSLLWASNNLAAGRAVYAVGSDVEAARLASLQPSSVVFGVFTLMGALVGFAALLNSVRFMDVPGNAGTGLELKAIAAVVVGGTSITGGRGTLAGTLIGVALLGTIGTALTFLGVNPFWEKAVQGAIILAALASDVVLGRAGTYARVNAPLR